MKIQEMVYALVDGNIQIRLVTNNYGRGWLQANLYFLKLKYMNKKWIHYAIIILILSSCKNRTTQDGLLLYPQVKTGD